MIPTELRPFARGESTPTKRGTTEPRGTVPSTMAPTEFLLCQLNSFGWTSKQVDAGVVPGHGFALHDSLQLPVRPVIGKISSDS